MVSTKMTREIGNWRVVFVL
jgi:hypothetical protein